MKRNYARGKSGEYRFFDGDYLVCENPSYWAIWRPGEETDYRMRRIGEDWTTYAERQYAQAKTREQLS